MSHRTRQTNAVAAPCPGDPVAIAARSGAPMGRASRLIDAAAFLHGFLDLFSTLCLKARSFTGQGVKGTPLVLASVMAVVVLRAAHGCAMPIRALFQTRALGSSDVLQTNAVGLSVLIVVEVERG